jgi:hypothetical protein
MFNKALELRLLAAVAVVVARTELILLYAEVAGI